MNKQRTNHNPRVVEGVRWANLVERPDCIPTLKRLPSGAKGAGLRYERLFAKQFPQSLHGAWFEYEDKFGRGYCQPDLIVSLLPKCLIVFEVKYTLTQEAFSQLNNLYLPIVRKAMAAPVIGCVVAKNLNPNITVSVTPILEQAIDLALGGEVPALHWVGQVVRQSHPLNDKDSPRTPFQFQFPARHIQP